MIRGAAWACVALVAACGASSYAEENGTESAPCYPNGTCNEGLTCASNRCVRIGGGGSDAGSSSDGSTDATSSGDVRIEDAGNDRFDGAFQACFPPSSAPALLCGASTCSSGDKCCAGEDACKARTNVCGGVSKSVECLSASQCASGEVCCARADALFDGTCPVLVNNVFGTKCSASCGTGEVQLCFGFDSTSCGGNACLAGTLEGSPGGNASVGVCLSM